MQRNSVIHALVAVGFGALVAYGCWSDQEGPAEALAPAEEVEPWFSVLASDSLASPARVALTPRGRLLVSDAGLGMVVAVDPVTLRAEQGFPVTGNPLAVGLIGQRVFVGNVTRRTIEVYSAHGGSLQRSFGSGVVEYPTDLAVDQVLGLVFVVDAATKRVKVFDTRGRARGTISGPGSTADRFQSPIGIAVDRDAGEVFVSDYGDPGGHAAVKIFDYEGNFLAEISGEGSCGMLGCSDGFSRPQGIELDGQGRIYVVDALLAQVLVYDRGTLEQVETLGGRDTGPPLLRLPLDLALDAAGDLFVVSNRTGSVEVFPGAGQP